MIIMYIPLHPDLVLYRSFKLPAYLYASSSVFWEDTPLEQFFWWAGAGEV